MYTSADGDKHEYDGEYKDGEPHGRGVFTSADGGRRAVPATNATRFGTNAFSCLASK